MTSKQNAFVWYIYIHALIVSNTGGDKLKNLGKRNASLENGSV